MTEIDVFLFVFNEIEFFYTMFSMCYIILALIKEKINVFLMDSYFFFFFLQQPQRTASIHKPKQFKVNKL